MASRAPSSPLAVIHLDSLARTGPRVRQASRREPRGRAGSARGGERRGSWPQVVTRPLPWPQQRSSVRQFRIPRGLPPLSDPPRGIEEFPRPAWRAGSKTGRSASRRPSQRPFLRVASGRRLPSRRRHLRLRGTFPTASRWAVTSLVTAEDPEPQRPRVQQQGLGFGTENSWFSLSPHCVTRLGRLRAHAA